MLVDVVPHDEDRSIQTLEQQAQESDDIRGADVPVTKESGVKRNSPPIGLDADRRDRGNLGPPASAAQDRSLSAGSPGPCDGRNQQETALVNEDEMGSRLFGVFLYAAKRAASNAQWPLRRAPERV